VLVFFLLAYGHRLYNRIIGEIGPVRFPDEIAPEVSRYLLTVTAINACLGGVVGGAMYLLDMPNPLLWAIMAFLLNYVPYLGAIVGSLIMFFAAMLSLDDSMHILLIPTIYMLITSIEGSLITPIILGNRFTLNPIVIFLWLMLWGWLWGVPGAIVAVPLLMAFRIFCEHIPPLAPLIRIMSLDGKRRQERSPGASRNSGRVLSK
jgi:predicted PurR-regulated permease PerM